MKTLLLRFLCWWWLLAGVVIAQAQTVDPAFQVDAEAYAPIHSVAMQPDGSCLVLGRQLFTDNSFTGNLTRLRPDGSIDANFQQRLGAVDLSGVYNRATPPAVFTYPDGRVLLIGNDQPVRIYTPRGVRSGYILRLLASGTVDSTFQFPPGTPSIGIVTVALQSDGKILLAGRAGLGWPLVQRLHANGTPDGSFQSALVANRLYLDLVNALVVQPDGKIIAGGSFLNPASGLVRLLPSGAADASFQAGATAAANIQEVLRTPGGSLLVAGPANTTLQGQTRGLHRLGPDGQLDASFQAPTGFNYIKQDNSHCVQQLPNGELLLFPTNHASVKVQRLLSTGQPAPGFAPDPALPLTITTTALDMTGNVLLAGTYLHTPGPQGNLLRMRLAGSLDPAFHPEICEPATVYNMLEQGGSLLLGGSFDKIQGHRASRIARLLPNGLVDTVFARRTPPLAGYVEQVAVQPSGRILLAGAYTTAGPARGGLVALQADGSLDLTFPPYNTVAPHSMAVQADGKILLGGYLATGLNGREIARLQVNGLTDNTFSVTSATNDLLRSVRKVLVQPDGKILVCGTRLLRLLPSGQQDVSFQTPELNAYPALLSRDMVLQPDGRILICGQVPGAANQRANLIRLLPGGARDTSLVESTRITGFEPRSISLQPDQKIVLGGGWLPNAPSGGQHLGLCFLSSRGRIDASPNPIAGSGWVYSLLHTASARLYLGGQFVTAPGLQQSFVRLIMPTLTSTQQRQPIDELTIYPNPAHQRLTVSWSAARRPRSIALGDLTGRPLQTLLMSAGTSTTLVVNRLPAGVYLLRAEYADGPVTRRVVIE